MNGGGMADVMTPVLYILCGAVGAALGGAAGWMFDFSILGGLGGGFVLGAGWFHAKDKGWLK